MRKEMNGVVYELNTKQKTAKITAYIAEDIYELVIPSTIQSWMQTFSVVEVGDVAFAYSDIRKLTLPKTLIRIGNSAFCESKISYIVCQNEQNLVIDSCAFANCTELRQVLFQNTVTLVGDSHFINCFKLENINSQNICGKIGLLSFSNCASLDEFSFRDDVVVEKNAFLHTQFNKVILGNNVQFIGDLRNTIGTANILCSPDSNILDLAYDGYQVSVV